MHDLCYQIIRLELNIILPVKHSYQFSATHDEVDYLPFVTKSAMHAWVSIQNVLWFG